MVVLVLHMHPYLTSTVPSVLWLGPNNQRKEADAAQAILTVPNGDHLSLINVYNSYMQSQPQSCFIICTDRSHVAQTRAIEIGLGRISFLRVCLLKPRASARNWSAL